MQLRYICKRGQDFSDKTFVLYMRKRLSMPTFYINFYSICKNKEALKTTRLLYSQCIRTPVAQDLAGPSCVFLWSQAS